MHVLTVIVGGLPYVHRIIYCVTSWQKNVFTFNFKPVKYLLKLHITNSFLSISRGLLTGLAVPKVPHMIRHQFAYFFTPFLFKFPNINFYGNFF